MRLAPAAVAALLLALPASAHAAPTAMSARIDVHFDCLGCGVTTMTGTLSCPSGCLHDGFLCVSACAFPVAATVDSPSGALCAVLTADGTIGFGNNDDAVFHLNGLPNGSALVTLRYASGATASGAGSYVVTAPTGLACGHPADATYTLSVSGQ